MMSLDKFCEVADRVIQEGLPPYREVQSRRSDCDYADAWKAGVSPKRFGSRVVYDSKEVYRRGR